MIIERETIQIKDVDHPIPCDIGRYTKVYDENRNEIEKVKRVDTETKECFFYDSSAQKYDQIRVTADVPRVIREFAERLGITVGWITY